MQSFPKCILLFLIMVLDARADKGGEGYVHLYVKPTFCADYARVSKFEGMIFETSQRIKI